MRSASPTVHLLGLGRPHRELRQITNIGPLTRFSSRSRLLLLLHQPRARQIPARGLLHVPDANLNSGRFRRS